MQQAVRSTTAPFPGASSTNTVNAAMIAGLCAATVSMIDYGNMGDPDCPAYARWGDAVQAIADMPSGPRTLPAQMRIVFLAITDEADWAVRIAFGMADATDWRALAMADLPCRLLWQVIAAGETVQ